MALADNVTDLLGTAPDSAQVTQALAVVTAVAKAHTRGMGFDSDGAPNDEIASVIVLATARLLRNPSQLAVREEMGALAVDYRGGFTGWSIAELAALNRYRVTAT